MSRDPVGNSVDSNKRTLSVTEALAAKAFALASMSDPLSLSRWPEHEHLSKRRKIHDAPAGAFKLCPKLASRQKES